jgi:hypothetical protein
MANSSARPTNPFAAPAIVAAANSPTLDHCPTSHTARRRTAIDRRDVAGTGTIDSSLFAELDAAQTAAFL